MKEQEPGGDINRNSFLKIAGAGFLGFLLPNLGKTTTSSSVEQSLNGKITLTEAQAQTLKDKLLGFSPDKDSVHFFEGPTPWWTDGKMEANFDKETDVLTLIVKEEGGITARIILGEDRQIVPDFKYKHSAQLSDPRYLMPFIATLKSSK